MLVATVCQSLLGKFRLKRSKFKNTTFVSCENKLNRSIAQIANAVEENDFFYRNICTQSLIVRFRFLGSTTSNTTLAT